ncbi:MAG: dihydrofolate reductase family protein [candidate division Zixibacteria bacterium]|nr:dihydrofolate reductase family protein [candidate division Zixibacteria bacterium]
MRKVIASEWMSLDGVVQAPAYTDEDPSGGFKYGGWHLRYFEERSMKWLIEGVSGAGGFLLGRRTYDVFAEHWPEAPQEEQAFAQPLNTLPKYVASRTLKEPLGWQNSMLLGDDIAESVAKLRRQDGKDLLLIGSTELAAALLAHDLVDELRLMIDPVILGGGKRFFRDDGVRRRFTLVTSETITTGAILATYARASAEAQVGASAVPLPRPPRNRA